MSVRWRTQGNQCFRVSARSESAAEQTDRPIGAILAPAVNLTGVIVRADTDMTEHPGLQREADAEVVLQAAGLAQVILDSIGDAVVSTDIAGNITYLNPVAERMTGWSRSEASG